jgi:hypothetical protein
MARRSGRRFGSIGIRRGFLVLVALRPPPLPSSERWMWMVPPSKSTSSQVRASSSPALAWWRAGPASSIAGLARRSWPSGLKEPERHLDQNVTTIDPPVAEERMDQYLSGATTQDEKRRALERYYEDRRRDRRDVPLVEDFPLAPEEETPDFMHLTMTLRLRSIRAYERWNGSTQVTLQDIIYRLAEKGAFNPIE